MNSNYPASTDCQLVNNIYATNYNFEDIFNNDSPYPYPKLIISSDKLKQQNKDIYDKYMDHGLLIVNNDDACKVDFNVRNLNNATNLQEGFARNIDLDSELKRINHIDDKCYYDNYKFHPEEAYIGNGLYCHKKTLVKDYTIIGKPSCVQPINPEFKSAIIPGHLQTDYRRNFDKCMSSREVNYGVHTTGDNPPTERLIYEGCSFPRPNIHKPKIKPWKEFNKCDNNEIFNNDSDSKILYDYKHGISGNRIDHYKFNGNVNNNNEKLTRDFPCQRLFNNNTKRSTLRNFHNLYDINPKYLT